MSPKSVIQLIILVIIFVIVGSVYYKYFSQEKIIVDQISQQTEKEIITDTQDKNENKDEIEVDNLTNLDKSKKEKKTETNKIDLEKSKEKIEKKNTKSSSNKNDNDIFNIVKDVEYLTADKNGNKYKILATSGRTNQDDKNILDLDNVKGEITSDERSTIYIVSDFAEYNSSTLGSKFYKNVVINYEDKQITCENFDINMDTNIAIAYNNVVVTDPKSTMKAGKIALNIETKEIDINPERSEKSKIQINTKQ